MKDPILQENARLRSESPPKMGGSTRFFHRNAYQEGDYPGLWELRKSGESGVVHARRKRYSYTHCSPLYSSWCEWVGKVQLFQGFRSERSVMCSDSIRPESQVYED